MGGSSSWPIERVPLASVRLDAENVRIRGTLPNENAIMAYLMQHEDAMALVRAIARDGYYDNEQPIVYQDGSDYVVLEGNRRVTALKALDDPDRVPVQAQLVRAAIARSDELPFPTSIRVMIAPGRAEALQVVARLHTRDSKKSWVLEQQAAFYYGRVKDGQTLADLRQAYPAEASKIARFLVMGRMIELAREGAATEPELLDFIDSAKFGMTTFEYLYNSGPFRDQIGVQVQDGIVSLDEHDEEFWRRLFVQILRDIQAKRINTRTVRVTDEGYASYLKVLLQIARGELDAHPDSSPEERTPAPISDPPPSIDDESEPPAPGAGGSGPDTTSTAGDQRPGADEGATPGTSPADAGSGRRNRQEFDRRLDTSGLVLRLPGMGLRQRYEELCAINVRQFPNATVDILRTFIECTIKAYFEAAGSPVRNPRVGHPAQLKHCIDHLADQLGGSSGVVSRAVHVLRARQHATSEAYAASSVALNDSNHDPEVVFSPAQVNAVWAQLEPLLRLLLAGPAPRDH